MTTTETFQPVPRHLQRSRDDRLAAGVCGGLGEQFGLDPVLFRVLFATAAFFGVGLVAYAIAWVAIPSEGSGQTGFDAVGAELRRRRIPLWVAAGTLGLLVWLGFIGGGHAGLVTLLVIAVALLVVQRRPMRIRAEAITGSSELRAWVSEAVGAARMRRRRRRPVYLMTFAAMVASAGVVAIVDASSRIPVTAYAWTLGAVLLSGLLVGAALRRTPLALALLLVPIVGSLVAFGGTRASLRDGVGDHQLNPTTVSLQSTYRQAFGQLTLTIPSDVAAGRHVRIDQAAGQLIVKVPATVDAVVTVHLNGGNLMVDGVQVKDGAFWDRTVVLGQPSAKAVHLDVHLGAGEVQLDHSTTPTAIRG